MPRCHPPAVLNSTTPFGPRMSGGSRFVVLPHGRFHRTGGGPHLKSDSPARKRPPQSAAPIPRGHQPPLTSAPAFGRLFGSTSPAARSRRFCPRDFSGAKFPSAVSPLRSSDAECSALPSRPTLRPTSIPRGLDSGFDSGASTDSRDASRERCALAGRTRRVFVANQTRAEEDGAAARTPRVFRENREFFSEASRSATRTPCFSLAESRLPAGVVSCTRSSPLAPNPE